MSEVTPTSERKADHIRVNLEEDVQSGLTTGLEKLHFTHNAVPEISMDEVALDLELFGRQLKAPLLISSMTGGTDEAAQINRRLAEAAQEVGVAMGLGSQRAAIEDPALAETFRVRQLAPDILLFANLGAVQFNYGYGLDECKMAVEMIEADALILHFNALQEALQPEGDINFAGLLPQIERVCRELEVPVVAKEVGWGFSAETAKRLVEAGIAAIDIAGAGGTSWSQVEMHRVEDPRQARLASLFIDWGIPTAASLRQVHQAVPDLPLFASGGLRSGVDIAKCIALGAELGGMASPFLKAANLSLEATIAELESTRDELKVCMFATGSDNLAALKNATFQETS